MAAWRSSAGGSDREQEWYAFTTETDGCASSVLGSGGGVWECHGSTELWRCNGGCSGTWRAPAGFRFRLANLDALPSAGPSSTTAPRCVAPPGVPEQRAAFHKVEMSSEDSMHWAATS